MTRSWTIMRSPRFWAVVVMFSICVVLRHPHLLLRFYTSGTVETNLPRHVAGVSGILFLAPITYAALAFGNAAGIASLIVTCLLLLPGIVLMQASPMRLFLEIVAVVVMAASCACWFNRRRREIQKTKRAVAQLEEARHLIQEYADQIGQAHEEERKRIARELHDDTVQTMVAVSRRLDTLLHGSTAMPQSMRKDLEGLHEEIQKALARMRDFVQDLRPPTLEYLGLVPALRELVTQASQQSGIAMGLDVSGDAHEFSLEKNLLIYRIVQEATRNVTKHSSATRSDVRIAFRDDAVTISVKDNGKGFRHGGVSELLGTRKLGLVGMKERARLLGGTIDVISQPSEGTVVALVIPDTERS